MTSSVQPGSVGCPPCRTRILWMMVRAQVMEPTSATSLPALVGLPLARICMRSKCVPRLLPPAAVSLSFKAWSLPSIQMEMAIRLTMLTSSTCPLGSSYGQPFDDDLSAAVENATAVGVLTVASAGNGGDKPYMLTGPLPRPHQPCPWPKPRCLRRHSS